jgi:hypothetical protein
MYSVKENSGKELMATFPFCAIWIGMYQRLSFVFPIDGLRLFVVIATPIVKSWQLSLQQHPTLATAIEKTS